MPRATGRIHIGTSGWHYPHWRGPFYPPALRERDQLSYYAGWFRTVEINNSFYRLPEPRMFAQWREAAGAGFLFAVKASRYITHMKKLKDPQPALRQLLSRVDALGDALGPILFQLPPRWSCDAERLGRFLDALPKTYRYAFEFRDPSWFHPRVYRLLAAHRSAFCIYELGGQQSPEEVTADFVYLRWHGPAGPYQGQYPTSTLRRWARACVAWSRQGREVFGYFDNDEAGFAAQDALRLQGLAAQRPEGS